MPYRWATFDCYGTLIDWNAGLAAALTSIWPHRTSEDLLAAYHRAEPAIQHESGRSYRSVLIQAARAMGADLNESISHEQAARVPDSLPAWPPFPEVPVALETLREHGWRLAILSNTDPDLLAASIAAIGVEPDLAITVADTGSYKPARGHWDTFFERAGADEAAHVHVAASLFHDIRPCAELGLRCVWINRLAERTTLPHLTELPDLTDLPATLGLLVPA